jgi:putative ABC transport system permease protein
VGLWLRTLLDLARSLPVQIAREFGQDAWHTLRLWRRRPLHTAFALAVLAIAIGANTGIFSVLNALLLRSLPFHDPERLASMRFYLPAGASDYAAFHEWRTKSPYAADGFMFTSNEVNLESASQTVRARLTESSWNFFQVLGARPAWGRGFAEGEDRPAGAPVAVIGHGLWQQAYGGDPSAIGSTIRLNGAPFTIVGIAAPGFDYPGRTALWTSTVFEFQRVPKTAVSFWSAVARLKSDLTWTQARQSFEAEAFAGRPERRAAPAASRPALIPLREELAGPVRQASFVLMAGAVLLLLLACANVANFLLGHTLAREQEFLIRNAMGASRARLAQQLLTETILLATVAAGAGLVVAGWTTRTALAFQPVSLASQAYSVLDWQVLTFTVVVSIGTGLLFGAAPVLSLTRRSFSVSTRTATAGQRSIRLQGTLILVQVAVTIVLLAASVALGRTFLGLLRIDNGYALQSIATMSVSFGGTPYMGAQSRLYYQQALERLRQLPEVTSVSATQVLPLGTDAYGGGRFTVDGAGAETLALLVSVAPDYFATLGGRVIAGREFTAHDLEDTSQIAVVNEEFARSFGGVESMIGRTVTAPRFEPRRIVGVVRGMRDGGPLYSPTPQIFWPSRSARAMTFVVRVNGEAADHLARIRDALASVDARVPVFNARTMEQRLAETLARPRFYATAVMFFGGLAMLLSIIGVYGVVSYACGERVREMGIRLALGTTATRLRGRLLSGVVGLVGVGAIAGGAAASAGGRYLRNLIPGAESAMAMTAVAAIGGMLLVASLATWLATRRVAHLDIIQTLRSE